MDRLALELRQSAGFRFLDFVVNGKSLWEESGASKQTLVGGLVMGTPGLDEGIDRLLLRRPSVLPSDRVPLFVCNQCLDEGCGVIAASIGATGGVVIWEHVAHTRELGDPDLDWDEPIPLPTMSFDRAEYEAVLNAARSAA